MMNTSCGSFFSKLIRKAGIEETIAIADTEERNA